MTYGKSYRLLRELWQYLELDVERARDQMLEIIRDPVWAFLGVLAAIIIGFVSIFLYLRDRNRKALSYEMVSSTSLVVVRDEVKERLKILYDDKPVSQLYLSLVRIVNSGNVPIPWTDFQCPLTITYTAGTQIVSAEIIEKNPRRLEATAEYKGNEATVETTLLNGGDSLIVKILHSGTSSTFTVDARIVGVREIKMYAKSKKYLALILLGIIMFASGEVFGLVGLPLGWAIFVLGLATFFYGWYRYPMTFSPWFRRKHSKNKLDT